MSAIGSTIISSCQSRSFRGARSLVEWRVDTGILSSVPQWSWSGVVVDLIVVLVWGIECSGLGLVFEANRW